MEERKMILKMIEDGKITAEEGIKLLEAMEKEEPASQKVQKGAEGSLSTEVDWEKGNDYRNHRREEEPASSKLTSFFLKVPCKRLKILTLISISDIQSILIIFSSTVI